MTDLMQRMVAMVRELADDVEANVMEAYPVSVRNYPAMLRRYVRDMAIVHEARALADEATSVQPGWDRAATDALR